AYGDRPVVLNVWRTWCGPCLQEMPDLQRLDGRESALGPVAVLAFSDEPVDLLKDARDALEIRFRLIRHEEDLYVLDVDTYPTTFVLHKGRVIDRWIGLRDDLVARVDTAVEKVRTAAQP
ncbi:MAG TPA: TlpA disulfide reductase family protein, partial [Candidatus Polarisedimenticolaceae bacterium]|nr:TlpA disulfide reductase family protein [Candidatus Polarisedimenticolaceae bacterium]